MNRSLRKIISIIRDFAEQCDHIEGYYEMSSVVRDSDFYYSVGGAIVFLYDCQMLFAVAQQMKSYVSRQVDLSVAQVFEGQKLVFITGDLVRFKVEFSSIGRINHHVKLLVDSGVRDYKASLLIDKDGRLNREFERLWRKPKDQLQEVFEELTAGFKYWSYEFRMLSTRLDHFRAYKAYVELYYKFVGLKLLASDNWKNLLSFKQAFYRKIKDDNEFEKIVDLAPQLFIQSLMPLYYRIIEDFLTTYQRICEHFGFQCDNGLVKYFEDLDRKFYPAYNFRDFALVVNQCMERQYLRQGKVFRSGQLDIFPLDYVNSLFHRFNIKTVIDLRRHEELDEAREYDVDEYFHVVIEEVGYDYDRGQETEDNWPFDVYYAGIAELQAEKLALIYRKIIEGLNRGAILVHCNAGKDRTGVVIALLQKLLGVPDKCIIEDYMASFTIHTTRDMSKFLQKLQARYGDVRNWFMEKAGLTAAEIEYLKSELLADD